VAFEPNSAIRRRLHENLALNGCLDIVTVNDCALGDVSGPGELYIPTFDRGGPALASLRRQDGWERGGYDMESTVVKRLDDLWRRDHTLRLLKLDVEGAELEVLRGGEQVIQARRPHVICEYNASTARTFGYDPAELVSFFRDRIGGYAVHALASRGIVYDAPAGSDALTHRTVENWWFCPREWVRP
jgi:FkbM family methyltransferase